MKSGGGSQVTIDISLSFCLEMTKPVWLKMSK